MKKIVYMLFFSINCMVYSQESVDSIHINEEYNELMNYIPKQLKIDKKTRPSNKFIQGQDLNTIISLHLLYNYKDQFGLNKQDTKWLNHRVDQLAVALFLDRKKILLEKVGGSSGCPNSLLGKKELKNHSITILKLCHSCTDDFYNYEFISIFNLRMKKLMGID